jgi:hypothetical protein
VPVVVKLDETVEGKRHQSLLRAGYGRVRRPFRWIERCHRRPYLGTQGAAIARPASGSRVRPRKQQGNEANGRKRSKA